MKRSALLSFMLIVTLSAFSQKHGSKIDSAVKEWRLYKTYPHRLVHVTIGGGPFLPLAGNTWEALSPIYSMYLSEGWGPTHLEGYPPATELSNGGWNIGLEFNINRRFCVGATLLPSQHRCFEGAGGQNYTVYNGWAWFGASTTTYLLEGYWIDEHIFSNSVGLNANYVIIPYKRIRKVGLELRGGANLLLNRIQVATDLRVWDDVSDTSGNHVVTSAAAHFDEKKILPGVYGNMRLDIFFGRGFSLFGQLYAGAGMMMTIKEKNLTLMNETAHVPQHKDGIRGYGFVFGIAYHKGVMKQKERKPIDPNSSAF